MLGRERSRARLLRDFEVTSMDSRKKKLIEATICAALIAGIPLIAAAAPAPAAPSVHATSMVHTR